MMSSRFREVAAMALALSAMASPVLILAWCLGLALR